RGNKTRRDSRAAVVVSETGGVWAPSLRCFSGAQASAQARRYCHVNVPEGLLRDLLPGPVTLVMERSEELNKDLNPFTPLVGIRIPDHDFMQDLAQMFGGPLALTSANLSSQPSSLNVEEFQDLWPQLSLVIDGGPIGDGKSPKCRLGSTVVDLSVPGKFRIIRAGCALENTTDVLQRKYGLLPHRDPAET
ncbi:PREDICTED: yrdC domain-containing protein, mitochondrial, partial [Myotis davidii]|uniref:yrdC domain-containing protein, mitochondrial n=1 Tax=Myotis davidii TaxID=225400 RepID=UPI0007679B75